MTAPTPIDAFPLIPRDHLFGNPSRIGGKLSPDGQWVSWMAPWEGVMNLWLAPFADPAAARRMTSARERPIPTYFWAPDSQSLLYIQDKAGWWASTTAIRASTMSTGSTLAAAR